MSVIKVWRKWGEALLGFEVFFAVESGVNQIPLLINNSKRYPPHPKRYFPSSLGVLYELRLGNKRLFAEVGLYTYRNPWLLNAVAAQLATGSVTNRLLLMVKRRVGRPGIS